MNVLVTGAGGFIGSNLVQSLSETEHLQTIPLHRDWTPNELEQKCAQADFVVHVAGVNRSNNVIDFEDGNDGFTASLVRELSRNSTNPAPLIFASTRRIDDDSTYGQTKKEAEKHVEWYASSTGAAVAIYRLPNVFGKWCRPNYNSVVATFCYNVARNLPVTIHNEHSQLTLVHIDDVIDAWQSWIDEPSAGLTWPSVAPEYQTTVGELASMISEIDSWRRTEPIGTVGAGLLRALYSTYISYLPTERLATPLNPHEDDRGAFSEVLRTKESGQFSFFTSKPGVSRGGHYHHTKVERFVVVRGSALFRMIDLKSGQSHEIAVDASRPTVIEMPPGWSHEVENTGDEEMLCMLWANELFDPAKPDTYWTR